MNIVITTIFFNGQFWIALVEKQTPEAQRYIARHVFGSEPSNGDLLHFYLCEYERLIFHESDEKIRIRKKMVSSQNRTTNSHREYRELHRQYLEDRKKERNNLRREEDQEQYRKKRERKKKKRRGV